MPTVVINETEVEIPEDLMVQLRDSAFIGILEVVLHHHKEMMQFVKTFDTPEDMGMHVMESVDCFISMYLQGHIENSKGAFVLTSQEFITDFSKWMVHHINLRVKGGETNG